MCIRDSLYPGLWHDIGPRTQHVRYAYMDSVSTLYGKNFAGRLGDWCRAHGVSYIGHVIEDNNAHVDVYKRQALKRSSASHCRKSATSSPA